jgi:hypothetical protein
MNPRSFLRDLGVTSPLSALSLLLVLPLSAQQATADAPLPDVPTLMHQVETNQRKAEAIQKDYIFNQSAIFDSLDSHNAIKKTESTDQEVYWTNGVVFNRTLAKNGKPLTPDELKKEDTRIDAEVQKAKARRDKADTQGKETDPRGHDEITLARILELGTFASPRRIQVNGRPTIVVDFTGDPHAKTHNSAEGLFKELAGTIYVDEQDKTVQHLEGHFDHDFKIGAGLVASVKQGTTFSGTFRKINDEVWLPESFTANGHGRFLLFFSLTGNASVRMSNYRKFKATSTILPGITTVDHPTPDDPAPSAPLTPAPTQTTPPDAP